MYVCVCFSIVILNVVCVLSEEQPCEKFGSKYKCKSIKDCPSYIPMIRGTYEDRRFLEKHNCGFEGLIPMVCCVCVPRARCEYTAVPDLNPNSKCCGVDGSIDRVSEGEPTNIYQYTWLILLEYKKKNKVQCSGSIISTRYVLTAAHCTQDKRYGKPSSVRLGEYNTDTREDYDYENKRKYTAKSVGIEKIVVHPEFSVKNGIYKNDIALIRLASAIKYNDLIRPICLPSNNVTERPPTKDLVLAGWGSEKNGYRSSPTKLHANIAFRDMRVCESTLKRNFSNSQICAGGQNGKGDCKGDSGGALMHDTGEKYEIVGIVSFSFKICGKKPSVYTNVIEYLPWIMKNILS